MSRSILLMSVAAGALAFLAMLTVTVIWMTVSERIVYQESSPVQTPAFSVEVKQHGTSFFVTPAQKKTLDRIANGTPMVWFGSLVIVVAAILVGAAARLRLPVSIE
jgi:hypothetical protein